MWVRFFMSLQLLLNQTAELTPHSLERFAAVLDPAWIDQALQQTGTVSLRRRRLPAERMVWLVIGLALFRNEPIWHIVQQLDLAEGAASAPWPVPSAAVAARERLGEAPLAWLFDRLARAWTQAPVPTAALFHGLRTLAVDGVVFSMPDTPANGDAFARQRFAQGVGSGWPQLRAVGLMDTYSHLLCAARFGDYAQSEFRYARALMEAAPDHSLTPFDRLYYSAALLLDWQNAGTERHWRLRARTPLRFTIVTEWGPGDWLVQLPVSPQARRGRPDLPAYWQARLIECAIDGRVRRFLTSLGDPIRYPATEVAQHYVWRWEIEMGFRDIKQGMLAGAPVLRSKLPELVRQEMWGVLIAYNLLRQEMRGMADELQIEPQRLSFRWLALTIAWALTQWPLQTPGALPKRLAWLRAHARDYLLPPRRKRTYPRALKSGQRKYPIKNASQLN